MVTSRLHLPLTNLLPSLGPGMGRGTSLGFSTLPNRANRCILDGLDCNCPLEALPRIPRHQ